MTDENPSADAEDDPELAEAEKGPFRMWAPFRMAREGLRFHRLRSVLDRTPFDSARADAILAELSVLAAERGRLEAETFEAIGGGLPHDYVAADPGLSRRLRELVDDPSGSRYFRMVSRSCTLLWNDDQSRNSGRRWYQGFEPRPRQPKHDYREWMRTKGSIDAEMISAFRLAALPILVEAGCVRPSVVETSEDPRKDDGPSLA